MPQDMEQKSFDRGKEIKMKLNILGTEYTVKKQKISENPKLKDANGICEFYSKEIILCDENW